VALLRALTPSKDEADERARIVESAEILKTAIEREMSRRLSGAVFGEVIRQLVPKEDELEDEVRTVYGLVAPMSIKVSDKVKKVIVHILKWWTAQASERFRASNLQIPPTAVDRFVREVCTSKALLPVLGNALFPYFSRSSVDPALIATILEVTICDAMVELFAAGDRRTPPIPVRLSYSEASAEGSDGSAIDWGTVDFDEEEPAAQIGNVEIVFAGNRYWKRWSARIGDFYLENRGAQPRMASTDPRAQKLASVLTLAEKVHVGAEGS
jgi:hypothetical protein